MQAQQIVQGASPIQAALDSLRAAHAALSGETGSASTDRALRRDLAGLCGAIAFELEMEAAGTDQP